MPDWVRSEVSEAYRAKGIKELYSHQAAAAELVHSGRNVVVVTPTASGKTLCYNPPVLNAVLENSDTRAQKYLAKTYGTNLGKASVTGYCIRFKALKDINIDTLEAAIRDGLAAQNEKAS